MNTLTSAASVGRHNINKEQTFMNRFLIILTFSLFAINCNGQKVSDLKIEKVFLVKINTIKNCYIIYPAKLPGTGYLFLIPGFGETAENILQ